MAQVRHREYSQASSCGRVRGHSEPQHNRQVVIGSGDGTGQERSSFKVGSSVDSGDINGEGAEATVR